MHIFVINVGAIQHTHFIVFAAGKNFMGNRNSDRKASRKSFSMSHALMQRFDGEFQQRNQPMESSVLSSYSSCSSFTFAETEKRVFTDSN